MKGLKPNNQLIKCYDVYYATYKMSDKHNLIINSEWKFLDTIEFETWDDFFRNNDFHIMDGYFMCFESFMEGIVCILAKYNTKTYINIERQFNKWLNDWRSRIRLEYQPGSRRSRYRHYRHPQTHCNRKQLLPKEALRFYSEEYPYAKMSLKNNRIRNLPTAWDDNTPRHYSRSWKDCTKKKHQYE